MQSQLPYQRKNNETTGSHQDSQFQSLQALKINKFRAFNATESAQCCFNFSEKKKQTNEQTATLTTLLESNCPVAKKHFVSTPPNKDIKTQKQQNDIYLTFCFSASMYFFTPGTNLRFENRGIKIQ